MVQRDPSARRVVVVQRRQLADRVGARPQLLDDRRARRQRGAAGLVGQRHGHSSARPGVTSVSTASSSIGVQIVEPVEEHRQSHPSPTVAHAARRAPPRRTSRHRRSSRLLELVAIARGRSPPHRGVSRSVPARLPPTSRSAAVNRCWRDPRLLELGDQPPGGRREARALRGAGQRAAAAAPRSRAAARVRAAAASAASGGKPARSRDLIDQPGNVSAAPERDARSLRARARSGRRRRRSAPPAARRAGPPACRRRAPPPPWRSWPGRARASEASLKRCRAARPDQSSTQSLRTAPWPSRSRAGCSGRHVLVGRVDVRVGQREAGDDRRDHACPQRGDDRQRAAAADQRRAYAEDRSNASWPSRIAVSVRRNDAGAAAESSSDLELARRPARPLGSAARTPRRSSQDPALAPAARTRWRRRGSAAPSSPRAASRIRCR